jgi:hypothetical protein
VVFLFSFQSNLKPNEKELDYMVLIFRLWGTGYTAKARVTQQVTFLFYTEKFFEKKKLEPFKNSQDNSFPPQKRKWGLIIAVE